MFGTEPWGYGDYGQFHMVVWINLAIAFAAGVVWRLRSGSFPNSVRSFVLFYRPGPTWQLTGPILRVLKFGALCPAAWARATGQRSRVHTAGAGTHPL
jgi:hypothetical protein